MAFTVSGIQRVNNQSRDKRRSTEKDKNKKTGQFNKILAEEITAVAPVKRTPGR